MLKKQVFGYDIYMRKTLIILAVFSLVSVASAECTNKHSLLLKAKNDFESGRYEEAIEGFKEAYNESTVIGDYILLWLARAYSETGNFSESNAQLQTLLKEYAQTPLKKKARNMQVKNIIAANEFIKDFAIFESYIKDYPEDHEIKFLYGLLLKDKGKKDKAKEIFKNIYINSDGIFANKSYSELASSDITIHDLIEKATNLLNAMEYKKAESILTDALARDKGKNKKDIFKKLGHALFKQKRYKEAAEAYRKAGDHYSKARSFYRAGDKSSFENTLKELISMKDRRAGALLLQTANDKRRAGETKKAVKIYDDVKKKYPFEAENAMWGKGWTYYLSDDYEKAHEVFSELHNTYGSSKYLYWKAQSLEKSGKNPEAIYSQFEKKGPDFYSVLSYIKQSQRPLSVSLQPQIKNSTLKIKDSIDGGNPDSEIKPFDYERANILMALGMTKEAVSELSAIARKTNNHEELIYICLKLQNAGEYRLAISIASRLPYTENLNRIMYPLAHWDIVNSVSEKFKADPFVILSIIREESRFDPDARSQAGALGLMQLMPQTAFRLHKTVDLDLNSNEQIYDIRNNITIGSYYINSLIKEFGSLPPAIAAYNAGEIAVRRWQEAGRYKSLDEFIEDIPYDETRNFVKRVITSYYQYIKSVDQKEEEAEEKTLQNL